MTIDCLDRDRFLLIDGADRRQPASSGGAVGLRRQYKFLGREYEYLMDKDQGGNFTLRCGCMTPFLRRFLTENNRLPRQAHRKTHFEAGPQVLCPS